MAEFVVTCCSSQLNTKLLSLILVVAQILGHMICFKRKLINRLISGGDETKLYIVF